MINIVKEDWPIERNTWRRHDTSLVSGHTIRPAASTVGAGMKGAFPIDSPHADITVGNQNNG